MWGLTQKITVGLPGGAIAILGGACRFPGANSFSDVADILSRDRDPSSPVLVYARSGVGCRLSARAPGGRELGPLVRDLARSCGGTGGGHIRRAGATIPCDRIAMFAKGWQEALAS